MRGLLFLELCLVFFVPIRVASTTKQNNHTELVIEPIVGQFIHSEGPHWDHRTQTLYFVDIEAQNICRFAPATKDLACIYIENGPVGYAIPVEGEHDKLIAGSGTDFILVSWNGQNNNTKSLPETLAIVDLDRKGTRWNDGKVDSSGRFWGGTIGPEVNDVVISNQASLYRIDSDLKPKKTLSPVTNSNGLAWNKQNNKFYYIDTPTLKVAAFDYEPTNGTISNKTIAFDLQKNNVSGLPDGMTIDTDGNLWVALYSGGGVVNVNPYTGEILRFVELPVKKVTSCTFGGSLLDTLFVTTSSRDLTKEEQVEQPHAGYVFAVRGLGVHGLVANSFKV
ncbi:PREDICTED: regucalcin-like [Habropoda laboriosa]|uniref:regucalcin-like n=1 Tax=Habropoda laboriosa TaxID=597456 RepID=UPI00083DAFD9|nr:PREDICTED: regucalcin-like [Habropoda laboriosa]